MIGTTLGKYQILEEIGRGGMAVVFKGYDRELEREVAIKILHPHLSSQPESKRRFHREARAVARLRFPNILEIYDYSGRDSEQSYIVTEFIHGGTLRRFRDEHPDLPTEVAALMALEICRGLRHAHENDIIHRDIKPENIMIQSDGVVKITDFGIAQMAGATQMTLTGQMLGSPAHMAPELIENQVLDTRADIFSLGTVLYWLVIGRLPFEGRTPHAVIKRIVEGDYPDPMRLRSDMGDRMAAVVRRCLMVDPNARYQSIQEVIVDLEAFLLDLDLAPTGEELCRYFADPSAYTDRHRRQLIETLIRRGKEERRRRQHLKALHYFNRVLSLDDSNEEVLGLVEGMTVRQRMRRLAEVATLVLTLGAAGWGVAYAWWARQEAPPAGEGPGFRLTSGPGRGAQAAAVTRGGALGGAPEPTLEAGLDSVEAGTTASEAGWATDGAAGENFEAGEGGQQTDGGSTRSNARLADGGPRQFGRPRPGSRLQPSPEPATFGRGGIGQKLLRLVRIVPNPPAARVVVDGRAYGEYGSALAQGIELAPGRHQVSLLPRDHTYEQLDFEVYVPEGGADGGLLVFDRTLPFRPALVRVNTAVGGATVSVPHRARARVNQIFPVRMHAPRETVEMVVDAEGYRAVVFEVELRAGEEYSRDVELVPESPRGSQSLDGATR